MVKTSIYSIHTKAELLAVNKIRKYIKHNNLVIKETNIARNRSMQSTSLDELLWSLRCPQHSSSDFVKFFCNHEDCNTRLLCGECLLDHQEHIKNCKRISTLLPQNLTAEVNKEKLLEENRSRVDKQKEEYFRMLDDLTLQFSELVIKIKYFITQYMDTFTAQLSTNIDHVMQLAQEAEELFRPLREKLTVNILQKVVEGYRKNVERDTQTPSDDREYKKKVTDLMQTEDICSVKVFCEQTREKIQQMDTDFQSHILRIITKEDFVFSAIHKSGSVTLLTPKICQTKGS